MLVDSEDSEDSGRFKYLRSMVRYLDFAIHIKLHGSRVVSRKSFLSSMLELRI
jgi:hypothetical protein